MLKKEVEKNCFALLLIFSAIFVPTFYTALLLTIEWK